MALTVGTCPMRISPPWHLTPVGQWLWWRVPVWHKARVDVDAIAFGYIGLRSRHGFFYAAITADYYDGYWPKIGMTYWRRSVRILGIPVVRWKRWRR